MESEVADVMALLRETAVTYGLDLIGALVILILGWVVAGWVRLAASKMLSRLPHADVTVTKALASLARYLVLIIVVVAVLAQFGVETASILALLGTAGLAIGLALQGTLTNIAAGFMLLILRPFRVGDYIDAEGLAGTVEGIGLFATEFTTFDGVYLVVPNNQIWTRAITNYSRRPTRRLDIAVGISYGDDIDKAFAALMELLKGDERVLGEPPPQVMVQALADSAVTVNLRCWTRIEHYWPLRFDLTKQAKETVEAAGCTIPFPQRDVHLVPEVPAGAVSAQAGQPAA